MPTTSSKLVLLLSVCALACAGEPSDREAPPIEQVETPPATADTEQIGMPADSQDARWTAGVVEKERAVDGTTAPPVLREVRTAVHGSYERIVFEFDGPLPGYKVEYVDRPVRQCGSGNVVELPGDAWLSLRMFPGYAHTEQGAPSVADRDRSFTGRNLKRLKLICDFEAVVEWVAAVDHPERFRVLELNAPDRLVIDLRKPE